MDSDEETGPYQVLVQEASDLMKQKLPTYIVQSFLVAGYDTLDAISGMDVTSVPNDSIKMIEDYISSECASDPRFARGRRKASSSATVFQFLPGHRQEIVRFVNEIKSKKTICTGKRRRHTDCTMPPKKRKEESSANSEIDLSAIYMQVRQQVVKWQRNHEDENVKQLQEHQQFDILVKLSEDDGHVAASIVCNLCTKSYVLGRSRGKVAISNWTKHVTKCVKKNRSTPSLHHFFSTQTSTPTTHSDQDAGEEVNQHFRLPPPC